MKRSLPALTHAAACGEERPTELAFSSLPRAAVLTVPSLQTGEHRQTQSQDRSGRSTDWRISIHRDPRVPPLRASPPLGTHTWPGPAQGTARTQRGESPAPSAPAHTRVHTHRTYPSWPAWRARGQGWGAPHTLVQRPGEETEAGDRTGDSLAPQLLPAAPTQTVRAFGFQLRSWHRVQHLRFTPSLLLCADVHTCAPTMPGP